MYYLLLPEDKKKIVREYRLRRLTVILGLISALLCILAAAMLPALFLTSVQEKAAEAEFAAASSKDDSAKEKDLTEEVAAIGQRIAALQPGATSTIFTALRSVVLERPAGIAIKGFFFDSSAGRQVRLTGTASRREDLARFGKILEADKMFAKVALPLDSLAGSSNLDFVITLDLAPEIQ